MRKTEKFVRDLARKGFLAEDNEATGREAKHEPKANNWASRVRVLRDYSTNTTPGSQPGLYSDMLRDRLSRLERMFKTIYSSNVVEGLVDIRRAKHLIEEATNKGGRARKPRQLFLLGLLLDREVDIRLGVGRVVIEDNTDVISLRLRGGNLGRVCNLLLDQVVLVSLALGPDGPRVVDIQQPQFFRGGREHDGELREDVYVMLLSDLHMGAKDFDYSGLKRAIDWVANKEFDKRVVENLGYVVLNGDILDLGAENRAELYGVLKDLLLELDDNIVKIILPGECDAATSLLPQPPIRHPYSEVLAKVPNTMLVGNPSLVSISGVKLLLYHGQTVPDLLVWSEDPTRPTSALKLMLRSRHLAITVNGGYPPLSTDPLLIEETPDVFAVGHVHKADAARDNNTLLLVTPSWLSRDRKNGFGPRAAVVNLRTLDLIWR